MNAGRALWMFAAGGALLVAAVVFYNLDADPAWLFGSPIGSGALVIAGAALLYLGWRARSAPETPQEE